MKFYRKTENGQKETNKGLNEIHRNQIQKWNQREAKVETYSLISFDVVIFSTFIIIIIIIYFHP